MRGLGGRILAFGTVVAGVLAWAAAPATADTDLGTVDGLTYIQGDPDGPAAPPVALASTATCPTGTSVVGGGAAYSSSTTSAPAEFWLNRSRPFDGSDPDTRPDDGWTGQGFNRFGTNKAFGAYAICSAGAIRYAAANASAPAGAGMTAKATCPGGLHVAGGGAGVFGPAKNAYLNSSHPFDSNDPGIKPDDGWRARAFNRAGPRKALKVHAECVAETPRYPTQSTTSTDFLLFTPCPSGTHGMSGGGSLSGDPRRGFINVAYPFASSTNPPDAGFVVGLHAIGGALNGRSYAVCKT